MIYDFVVWYLLRRWAFLGVIKRQTFSDNKKMLNDMISVGMVKRWSDPHRDFINMIRIYSK